MLPSDDDYRRMFREHREKFLPIARERFLEEGAKKERRRAWWAEVTKGAVGSSIGTFVGGAALVLLGGLLDVIPNLPVAKPTTEAPSSRIAGVIG
jgi:hypothetical protein